MTHIEQQLHDRRAVLAQVAAEQAEAIRRALSEDDEHRRADLHDTAVKEAEAVPWTAPAGG